MKLLLSYIIGLFLILSLSLLVMMEVMQLLFYIRQTH